MLVVEQIDKVYEPPRGLLRIALRTAQSSPVPALQSIDFQARAGQVIGLVGPNGAGKTTLIRICTSLLTPTAGRVLIDGQDIAERSAAARAATGLLLTDDRALYWRLTGRENLRFFGVMAGLSSSVAAARANALIEQFDLDGRDRLVFGYSSGMRVRLGLARAMIAEPALLILDEPTRSLDPLATAELGEHIARLAADGVAIVLSSHRLDEVESMCDRVLVLVDGRQRRWATMAELAAESGSAAESIRRLLDTEPEQR